MDPKEDLRGGEDVEMMPLGEGKGGVMEGEKPKGSWAGFLFWTGVNTFATIGIVSLSELFDAEEDEADARIGLHKQSHLHRPGS